MPVTIETAQALGDPTLVGEEVDEEPDVPQVAVTAVVHAEERQRFERIAVALRRKSVAGA
jgi:hypothetical protein